jgi:hypothetical protein
MGQTRRRRLATCMLVVLIGDLTIPAFATVSYWVKLMRPEVRTSSRMYDLQDSHCLGPFRESAHTRVYSSKAYEWYQQYNSTENHQPQDRRHEIVEDQVLGFHGAGLKRFWARLSPCVGLLPGIHSCENVLSRASNRQMRLKRSGGKAIVVLTVESESVSERFSSLPSRLEPNPVQQLEPRRRKQTNTQHYP